MVCINLLPTTNYIFITTLITSCLIICVWKSMNSYRDMLSLSLPLKIRDKLCKFIAFGYALTSSRLKFVV